MKRQTSWLKKAPKKTNRAEKPNTSSNKLCVPEKRAHMSVGAISKYQPIKVNRVLEVKNVVSS